MMSEQQFALDKLYYSIMTPIEKISVGRNYITYGEVVDLLNEQQATIQFLQNEIDELKKDIDIYKYEEKKHSETARKLYEENEQLKQILKDIVEVTDETYTKNTSICKVIAVFDYKKYLKIKECLNE